MKHYLIKLLNGLPIEKSLIIESIEIPEIPETWDEIWTETEWLNFLNSKVVQNFQISKEEIHKLAEDYQDLYFDNKGVLFLLNLKQNLILNNGETISSNLTYQMIESIIRWTNKIWSFAFLYDSQASNNITPSLNYLEDVGVPPCSFRDLLWTFDENFNNLEPDRIVNLDINYYINWV